MSAREAAPSATRTLPARAPDGFWRGNPHYFWYVLFAGTGFVLSLASLVVLYVLSALGTDFKAWQRAQSVLASPPVLLFNLLVLVGVVYFAVRFLWVGVKIPSVQLGRI